MPGRLSQKEAPHVLVGMRLGVCREQWELSEGSRTRGDETGEASVAK